MFTKRANTTTNERTTTRTTLLDKRWAMLVRKLALRGQVAHVHFSVQPQTLVYVGFWSERKATPIAARAPRLYFFRGHIRGENGAETILRQERVNEMEKNVQL